MTSRYASTPDERHIVAVSTRLTTQVADAIVKEISDNDERYSCLGTVIGKLTACGFLGLKKEGATPDEAYAWLSNVLQLISLQVQDYGYTVSMSVGEKRA